jgi:hypothetical protein
VNEEDHEHGDRTAFFLHGTAGFLEHIEHCHDIAGCLDTTTVGILVGSWTPRASGFRPGVSLKTFGNEKRLRGHVCQLGISNSRIG